MVLAALVLLVSRASWRGISMDLLLTNTGLFLLLSLPAILATCLLWTGRLLLRLRQWGRSAGDPLPAPRRTSAWAAAWLCLFCRLWGVAVTLCFLLDAGRYQSWWEDPSGEVYEVDCYAARWEWLARLVLDIKRESWYPPVKDRPHVWLHEADLGGGKTESALLLRVGKTVVMVDTRDGPIPMEQIDRLVNILSSQQEV